MRNKQPFTMVWVRLVLATLFLALSWSVLAQPSQALRAIQLEAIGDKIYFNETGGNETFLIAWNTGESFASLGIGHFIWFPANLDSPFTESFPELLAFLQDKGELLPTWLTPQSDCPWPTKQAFEQSLNSVKMNALRKLLKRTTALQTEFMLQRMQRALPKMLQSLDNKRMLKVVEHRFVALANTELGIYSLIDYVNFKGEGVSPKERYKDQGWGLLQVLSTMDENTTNIHQAFANSCKQVLTQRVANSPRKSIEQKWLAGWEKRCESYQ